MSELNNAPDSEAQTSFSSLAVHEHGVEFHEGSEQSNAIRRKPWWADIPDAKFTGNPMPIFSELERRAWLEDREPAAQQKR